MPQILKTQSQAASLAVAAFKSAGYDTAKANQLGEIASALAMAETFTLSGGVAYCDFGAVGDLHLVDRTYGPSYGAWQIRSLLAQSGKKTTRDPVELAKFGQKFNATAMVNVYRSQGWRAWSTYTSEAYLAFLGAPKYNPPAALPAGTYRVTGGDTLGRIALTHQTTVAILVALNHIKDANLIHLGQVILLPEFPYEVQSGDNLTKIGTQFHLTWFQVWERNRTQVPNPNILSLPLTLTIPRVSTSN